LEPGIVRRAALEPASTPATEVFMRSFVILAGAVLLGGATSFTVTAATPASAPKPASAPRPAATPKPPKPAKSHSASGTVESVDEAAKTLTVKGTKTTWTFDVTDARVWDGSKSVGLEDIASRTGAKVTIKYTDSEGKKSATSVRLAATHGGKSGSK
jgi:hypothetical protein